MTTQPSPRSEAVATSKTEMHIVVVRRADELARHVATWDNLAANACESNVFYESWMLLAALEAFGAGQRLEFHLIFAPGRGPDSQHPLLCGLFPFERRRRYKRLPLGVLKGWKHSYCPFCTPLIRKGHEVETLDALFEHAASARGGAPLIEWDFVSAEGPFQQSLIEVLNARQAATFVDDCWNRGLLKPNTASSDEYLRAALSQKRRKEMKRQENRLAETGRVQYMALGEENSGEFEDWLDAFLQLEASGWKRESGTAFLCQPSHEKFFRTITARAYERGRLMMTALRVNDRPIALTCDFATGEGSFAFKIAFDETQSRYSPGVLLEIEGIRRIHDNPHHKWVDSCAVRGHFMINRLWTERRLLQNIVIATRRGRGEFVVSTLPFLRYLKRVVSRLRAQGKS
jgi:hypothetical protein